jgi:hypothetical protein
MFNVLETAFWVGVGFVVVLFLNASFALIVARLV